MKRSSATRKRKGPVTREMNLREVLEFYPDAGGVMTSYGLHCVGCFANSFDTIEDAMKIHGMSEEVVDEMVEKINNTVTKKKS